MGEIVVELLVGLAQAVATAAAHAAGGAARWVAETLDLEAWDRWERRDEEPSPSAARRPPDLQQDAEQEPQHQGRQELRPGRLVHHR